MKKELIMGAVLTSMVATSMPAFAQDDLFVQEKALKAENLTDETLIAFKGVSVTNSNWINFSGTNTTSPTENGIFTVETMEDGKVLLKRYSDNLYIGREGDNIRFVATSTEATPFTVSTPALDENAVTVINEVSLPAWAVDQGYQIRFTTSDSYYLNVQSGTGTPKYANGKGSWSIMMAYGVTENDYSSILFSPYKTIVALSEKGAVGSLNKEDGATLQGFIETNTRESYEQAKAFMEQPRTLVSFNPEQYYRIENLTRKYSTRNGENLNNGGYLEAVDHLETPVYTETLGYRSNDRSSSRAQAIWRFEGNGTDGQYYLKSLNAGTYMSGSDSEFFQNGVTTTETATAFTLEALGDCQYKIKKAGSAQRLHASGPGEANGAAIMFYNGGEKNSASAWYLIPATSIDLSISAAGYATANYPFAVQLPEGVTAYTGTVSTTGETGVFELAEVSDDIVPANTPVILEGAANTYALTILPTHVGDPIIPNDLTGSTLYTAVETETQAYILGNGTNGIGFYEMNAEDRTMASNKAYITLPATAHAIRSITIGGPTTGIENTVAEGAAQEEYYDLQGRRVMNPTKGIYVTKSGKKVLFNK